jgi:hypothetical protein
MRLGRPDGMMDMMPHNRLGNLMDTSKKSKIPSKAHRKLGSLRLKREVHKEARRRNKAELNEGKW